MVVEKKRYEKIRRILTNEIQKQLDDATSRIIAKTTEMGQEANLAALRLCMERILPLLKARWLSEPLPTVSNYATLISVLLEAVNTGELDST
jgi:hypothetical protein